MPVFKENAIQDFVGRPLFGAGASGGSKAAFPKLAVITPSYNQAEFLERTILSVLNQNYPNLEYIIMDGGSTDGSVNIIRRYEKHLAYWISEKDGGQTAAINAGFRKATADWVTFQNSDDVFAPGAFAAFAAALGRNPAADVIYGHMLKIDEADRITEHLKVPPFWDVAQVYEGMQVFNQSMIFRKSLLERYGYLDESYHFAFDYEICTRWCVHPEIRFVLEPGFWGAFRDQPNAKSLKIADVGRREHAQISTCYQPQVKAPVALPVLRKYLTFRKLFHFLSKGDLSYFLHRYQLSRKG